MEVGGGVGSVSRNGVGVVPFKKPMFLGKCIHQWGSDS